MSKPKSVENQSVDQQSNQEIKWTQAKLEEYINDRVEESLHLDYKAAGALDMTEEKRKEIRKDISAMVNADGGHVIYGIKEFQDKNHLPEKIDPIDRTKFSKEWLEHIISNIQPRISDLIIHSVEISTSPNHVVYIVEIPRGTTAHQSDYKYYRRYNFEACLMDDYKVKEVINRINYSDVDIRFALSLGARGEDGTEEAVHFRRIHVIVKNAGNRIVNHYKVELTFDNVVSSDEYSSETILVELPSRVDNAREQLVNTEIGLSGSLYIT